MFLKKKSLMKTFLKASLRRHSLGCCCSLQPKSCEPTSCGCHAGSCGCHAGSCLHSRLLQRQSCADAYPQGGPDVHQGPVLHLGGPGALIVRNESVIDHLVPVISIISLSHCRAGLLEQLWMEASGPELCHASGDQFPVIGCDIKAASLDTTVSPPHTWWPSAASTAALYTCHVSIESPKKGILMEVSDSPTQ